LRFCVYNDIDDNDNTDDNGSDHERDFLALSQHGGEVRKGAVVLVGGGDSDSGNRLEFGCLAKTPCDVMKRTEDN